MPEPRDAAQAEATPGMRRRTPLGLKLFIGCGALVVVVAVVGAVVVGAGGMWIKDKADGVVSGLEESVDAQREASAILDRLAREHPFTPPADGRIDPASVERFFRATDAGWVELEPFATRMTALSERARNDNTGIRDVLEGARGAVDLTDSRLVLAKALKGAGLSLGEYVWTGQELMSAWRDANAPASYRESSDGQAPVRAANEELVSRHANRLGTMDRSAETANPAFVLNLALLWSTELPSSPWSSEQQGEQDE
jgi:hypothetical protein